MKETHWITTKMCNKPWTWGLEERSENWMNQRVDRRTLNAWLQHEFESCEPPPQHASTKTAKYNEIISVNLPIDMLWTINQHSFSTRNVSCRLKQQNANVKERENQYAWSLFALDSTFPRPLNTRALIKKKLRKRFFSLLKNNMRKLQICCTWQNAECWAKLCLKSRRQEVEVSRRYDFDSQSAANKTWLIGHARALYWRSIYPFIFIH